MALPVVTANRPGSWLGPYSASSRLLVYSRWRVVADPQGCDPTDTPGAGVIGGGRIWVAGAHTRPRRLPHSGPAVLLAASAGRVASVPAAAGSLYDSPTGARAIELRSIVDGDLIAHLDEDADIRAISLSGRILAALLERPTGGWAIDRFAARDGRLIGRRVLKSAATASVFTIAGDRVVYMTLLRHGRATLRLLEASGDVGRLRVLGRRTGGVSVLGSNVYWYQNARRPGRYASHIFVLPLPR